MPLSLDIYGVLKELLETRRTAPVSTITLLHGRHQVLQILGKVLMFVAEKVNLQSGLMDLGAVLTLRHPVPDPQNLDCGVIVRVHQIEKVLHKALPQEQTHFPAERLIIPQDDVQEHEEAIDGAGVFQIDFNVQGYTRDGLLTSPYRVHPPPGEHRPPEGAILCLIVLDQSTDLFDQGFGPVKKRRS